MVIDTRKWLTPKEVAELLRYSTTDKILDACRDGELHSMNRGTPEKASYLIDPASVAEWQQKRISGKKKTKAPAEAPLPPGVERFV